MDESLNEKKDITAEVVQLYDEFSNKVAEISTEGSIIRCAIITHMVRDEDEESLTSISTCIGSDKYLGDTIEQLIISLSRNYPELFKKAMLKLVANND